MCARVASGRGNIIKNFLHYKGQCVTITKQSEISVFSSKAWQCLSKVNSMAVSVIIRMMVCGNVGIKREGSFIMRLQKIILAICA